MDHLHMTSTK